MPVQRPANEETTPSASGKPPATGAAGAAAEQGENKGDPPLVSVIVPARDAEDTIEACLDSILSQDYPGRVEVLVADGSDSQAVADLVKQHAPRVRLLANHAQSTPNGLNVALQASRGEVIVRCDAHAILPPGYLRRSVEMLSRTGAANVGGRQHPVGDTFFERAVALAMGTWCGSGGAHYRRSDGAGAVDTVYLGVFRRDVLDAVEGFNLAFERHQDYELNWRLRERGETVWFDPGLVVTYKPRSNLWQLARQYAGYGWWKFVMLRRYPASLRRRHLAAPVLVLSLAAAPLAAAAGGAAAIAGAIFPAGWLTAVLGETLLTGIRRRAPEAVLLPLVLATMHLVWGCGFLCSALRTALGWLRVARLTPGAAS